MNSGAKVANLNADKLDGVDATDFVSARCGQDEAAIGGFCVETTRRGLTNFEAARADCLNDVPRRRLPTVAELEALAAEGVSWQDREWSSAVSQPAEGAAAATIDDDGMQSVTAFAAERRYRCVALPTG